MSDSTTPRAPIPGTMSHDLVELDAGAGEAVGRVQVREEDKLVYLAWSCLVPGANLSADGPAPFGGPIGLNLDGRSLVIGSGLARRIRLETLPAETLKNGA